MVTALGTAAVLFIGVRHVQQGALTLGELLMVIAYLSQLYEPLKTISKKAATLQIVVRQCGAGVRVPGRAGRRAGGAARGSAAARAGQTWSSAGCRCGMPGGRRCLRDLSFRVEKDATVGIFGATGAGKTTLVSLLVRFYDPTAGAVLLDGLDLRGYQVADLRRQVAFVLQDPVLFSTSIGENIRYARPNATLARGGRCGRAG